MNGMPATGAGGVPEPKVTGIWMILRHPVLATNILVPPLLNARPFAPQQLGKRATGAPAVGLGGGKSTPFGSFPGMIQGVAWIELGTEPIAGNAATHIPPLLESDT